ncbi:MAG: glycosyltransferase, partial [Paracoccaceae bacterium]
MSRRLAIFLPLLTGGGAERVTLSLAEGLRAEGVAVDLVVLRAEGPLVPLVPEGVRLVALALPRARAAPRAIARYLQAARPDAMLSVLPEMDVAAALGRLLSRHRPRLVWTVHSMPSALPLLAGRHRARMLRLMLRALLPGVSRVVAVSEGAAAEYRALIGGGAPLGPINNPGPHPPRRPPAPPP